MLTPRRLGYGCAGLVGLLILVVVIVSWGLFGEHIDAGFHLASLDSLPAEASDISFARNNNIANTYACEFRISEKAFESFARDKGWTMNPIDKEDSTNRYTWILPIGQRQPYSIAVDSGLSFDQHGQNGAGIKVIYSAKTQTAYIFSTNR